MIFEQFSFSIEFFREEYKNITLRRARREINICREESAGKIVTDI